MTAQSAEVLYQLILSLEARVRSLEQAQVTQLHGFNIEDKLGKPIQFST